MTTNAIGQEEVKEAVIQIINEVAPDEDTSDLEMEVSLREQLELDSMDFLDIVMELRKRHKIEVPPEDYPNLETPGQMCSLPASKIQCNPIRTFKIYQKYMMLSCSERAWQVLRPPQDLP